MIDPLTDVPNVVKVLHIGNTTVKIADNYCRDKTPEEVQEILRRIARTAQASLTAAAIKNNN